MTCMECDVMSDSLCVKGNIEKSLGIDDYCYINYLLYLLYAPLYLAGPIISFNNFMHQIKKPLRVDTNNLVQYAIRWVAMVLLMEFMLHMFYVVAIKDTKSKLN